MDIKRRIFDGEYNTAYTGLLKMNFQIDDLTVGTKGNTKVILEEDSVILIYGNDSREMTYNSFKELIEPYNELLDLLAKKGFKKRTEKGADIFEYKDVRIRVESPVADPDEKRVEMKLGGFEEKTTYKHATSVVNSY
jgi:hypothetical protein